MNRSVTELVAAALFLGLAALGVIDVLPFTLALGPLSLGRFGTTVLFLCIGGLFLAHGYAGLSKKPLLETPEAKAAALGKGATSPDADESAWERFKANVRMIGGAVLLAVFIRIVLFEAFEIDGPSMEPTLQNGDRVVVAKMLYGLFLPWTHEAVMNWGGPKPGDVVIVNSPLDGVDIVKRVIGVAGDTIEVRDRVVFRNGEALPQEDLGPCLEDEQLEIDPGDDCHVYQETLGELTYRVSDSGAFFRSVRPITIPEGHVFVRGDHRDRSNDSTNPQIGAIPVNRIKGRALAIYLSCIDEPGGWWICDHARWDRLFQAVR